MVMTATLKGRPRPRAYILEQENSLMSPRHPLIAFVPLALALLAVLVVTMTLGAHQALAIPDTLYVASSGDCGIASPCYTTLQAAVDASSDGSSIKVAQGVYTSTSFQVVYIDRAITMTGGYSTADWTISYPVTQPAIVDARNVARRRGFFIDGTGVATITLAGLTIQRGYAQDAEGGGVYLVTGTLVLRDSSILSNTATGGNRHGGGLYAAGGKLDVSSNTFQRNSATGPEGGGFTSAAGGAIYVHKGIIDLHDNTIEGNEAEYGGGLGVYYGSAALNGNSFQDNKADQGGGGVHIQGGVGTLKGNTFDSNLARMSHGGGVYLESCAFHLAGNTFAGNTAPLASFGGAVRTFRGRGSLINNDIRRNEAKSGGGVQVDGSVITITHNTFVENVAVDGSGGGLYLHMGAFTLADNTFQGNTADRYGGGIYLYRGTATLSSNTILRNTAGSAGGGIVNGEGLIDAENDIIAENAAPWEGVYLAGGSLTARHWTLTDNGNYALTTGGGTVVLTNTVIATHTYGGLSGLNIFADHTLFFNSGVSCGNGASCANNLTGDPSFTDPLAADYHLGPWSAAVDQGIDAGVTSDADGESRPMRLSFDLGADEQTELPMALFKSSSPDWLGQTTVFTDATYTFGPTTFLWDLGDGATSMEANPTHAYAPGGYSTVVTATNAAGSDTASSDILVYSPPSAGFLASPVQGINPLMVVFANIVTTIPPNDTTLEYQWHFGDGDTSTLPSPTHSYVAAGSYTVSLTVTNVAGSDASVHADCIIVSYGMRLPLVLRWNDNLG